MKPGLTVLGGRTSQGKSSFALQLAYDLASQGNHCLFLSLEMTVENLIERLFCNVMEVDNFELLTGGLKIKVDLQEKWIEFEEKIKNTPLLITCGIGQAFNEVNVLIETLDPKPKVVVVDYIQAIRQMRDERVEMNEYIRKFREICLKNKIAGVLCSQINRKVEKISNYEPSLENLKATGVLEEHSDTVLLLHWQNFYDHKADNENQFKVIVAKQRNGRTGDYTLIYKPEYYRFYDEQPMAKVSGEGNGKGDEEQDKIGFAKEMFSGRVLAVGDSVDMV